MKIIIVPGMGCSHVRTANFYATLQTSLQSHTPNAEVILQDFPDPYGAKESIWIPHLRNTLKADEDTILIGHSSGASAAMRFAELYPIKGMVLISTALTDMGDEQERKSEYFSRPWKWDTMIKNVGRILQISAVDDHLIPVEEQRQVAEGLKLGKEYVELAQGGHFMKRKVPEIEALVQKWMDGFETMTMQH